MQVTSIYRHKEIWTKLEPCIRYMIWWGISVPIQMLYCNVCCEPFHEFCLEEEERPHEIHSDNWCCKKCQSCQVCGRQNNVSLILFVNHLILTIDDLEFYETSNFERNLYLTKLDLGICNFFFGGGGCVADLFDSLKLLQYVYSFYSVINVRTRTTLNV